MARAKNELTVLVQCPEPGGKERWNPKPEKCKGRNRRRDCVERTFHVPAGGVQRGEFFFGRFKYVDDLDVRCVCTVSRLEAMLAGMEHVVLKEDLMDVVDDEAGPELSQDFDEHDWSQLRREGIVAFWDGYELKNAGTSFLRHASEMRS